MELVFVVLLGGAVLSILSFSFLFINCRKVNIECDPSDPEE
jgi:hypothetical protein